MFVFWLKLPEVLLLWRSLQAKTLFTQVVYKNILRHTLCNTVFLRKSSDSSGKCFTCDAFMNWAPSACFVMPAVPDGWSSSCQMSWQPQKKKKNNKQTRVISHRGLMKTRLTAEGAELLLNVTWHSGVAEVEKCRTNMAPVWGWKIKKKRRRRSVFFILSSCAANSTHVAPQRRETNAPRSLWGSPSLLKHAALSRLV